MVQVEADAGAEAVSPPAFVCRFRTYVMLWQVRTRMPRLLIAQGPHTSSTRRSGGAREKEREKARDARAQNSRLVLRHKRGGDSRSISPCHWPRRSKPASDLRRGPSSLCASLEATRNRDAERARCDSARGNAREKPKGHVSASAGKYRAPARRSPTAQ